MHCGSQVCSVSLAQCHRDATLTLFLSQLHPETFFFPPLNHVGKVRELSLENTPTAAGRMFTEQVESLDFCNITL